MSSDTVKSFTGILYFFSECNFHLFLYWSSSDTLLFSNWILGPALSYAVCTYETRYWAQPFPMQFEHMGSIGPHNYKLLIKPIYGQSLSLYFHKYIILSFQVFLIHTIIFQSSPYSFNYCYYSYIFF